MNSTTDQLRLFESPPSGAAVLGGPNDEYRYVLRRNFVEHPRRIVNFIMLNPSTADASADDPTIRRCRGFARSWGYDGLVVTNLFAFRATDPDDLPRDFHLAVGPDNDQHIIQQSQSAALVVCAWGQLGRLYQRGSRVRELITADLHYLKMLSCGQPGHPLFLRGSLSPVLWQRKDAP